jgi:hypothetical protein
MLLNLRKDEYTPVTLERFKKNVKVLIAENVSEETSLKTILLTEQNNNSNNNARILLIPYKINVSMWVGVFIEFL